MVRLLLDKGADPDRNDNSGRSARQYMELMSGKQAKAQQYFFFAERKAAKIDDIPEDTKARDIKRVAAVVVDAPIECVARAIIIDQHIRGDLRKRSDHWWIFTWHGGTVIHPSPDR